MTHAQHKAVLFDLLKVVVAALVESRSGWRKRWPRKMKSQESIQGFYVSQ
jgi:hypothetical protein